MEKAFKEMVFEWEYLHPKSAVTNDEELSPALLIPAADAELEDELKEEEIYQEEAIFSEEKPAIDEVVAVEDETASQVMEEEEEYETDWGLQSLLFEEEEEDDSEIMEFEDPKIKEKYDFETFRLKKWLRSAVMAAATISLFIMGGGRAQLTGKKRKNIQSAVLHEEKGRDVFVQHHQAALPSFSLIGHNGERF